MQKVHFTTPFGDDVSFDKSGDPLPIYDIMNWVWLPKGGTEVKNVGEVKRSALEGNELIIQEDKIFWNFLKVSSYRFNKAHLSRITEKKT